MEPTTWSFKLPNVIDMDPDDEVSISATLGSAANFTSFDASEMKFRIDDLSSDLVTEGSFSLTFTLDDGEGSVLYTILLDVRPSESPEAD